MIKFTEIIMCLFNRDSKSDFDTDNGENVIVYAVLSKNDNGEWVQCVKNLTFDNLTEAKKFRQELRKAHPEQAYKVKKVLCRHRHDGFEIYLLSKDGNIGDMVF